ncbi:phosphoesterase superfamily protein [Aspergillus sclerotioniger CBS 115572]|uniref:Phosphoesterase superfamily protein n=1 Tax=Aspergillus sclerotioniger CBS 115572 TaxID=1450535 RepID=A0A317WUL8_9EURO|nr:phosphoesterase superfamily protein [Aspergillus sclerotioniger CBS 115572]PWY88887.1 phosphoesterase superfamily protein [Aspergillus sclerotioniger CBS 115572]
MHPSALVGLLAFAAAAAAIPTQSGRAHSDHSIQNLKSKIKSVVVLVMENRSVDNLLGGQTIQGLENPINNGPYCNPYNVTDLSKGIVCSAARDYDSVTDDPDHAVYGNNFEFYGTFNPENSDIARGKLIPSQEGFVQEQLRLYSADANRTKLSTQVMNYYTEDQVPVLTTLVQNYVAFNHWHSDIPGPTDPNRAALVSGTSYGHGDNDDAFSEHAFPQRSIFQQLTETGHSWINYYDTAGGTGPDAGFFNWTYATSNTDKIQPLANFYTDAAAGSLPEFTYINPSCCGVGTNSMHPSGLISDGEKLIKDVYDALRAGPQWNETLFILSFDETGGFHDHVPPPLAPRPDNLTYTATAPSGESYTFEFNRLGGRIPTLLISPWVGKGYVEQKGMTVEGKTVSYSASSILRTLGYLWDFKPFTPRVEYAPSFEHLIQKRARNDTPTTLPTPVPFRQ